MNTFLQTFLQHFTYIGLSLVLVASGLGMPIPEDIPLTFSGYLCHPEHSPMNGIMIDTDGDGVPDTRIGQQAIPNLYVMMVAGMVGVLAGDTIIYMIGRHGLDSNTFVARHLRKVLHSKRREKVERHFAKHGNLTVIAARFFPGARSIVFAMAGISRMNYARFLMLDGCAALISVPLFILLGYHFAYKIHEVINSIDHWKHVLAPIALVILLTALLFYLIHRRRAKLPSPG